MILLTSKGTFRVRLPEWVSSLCMLLWGAILIVQPINIITASYLAGLALIMPFGWWGAIAMIAGALRLVALGINGYWRPTAHLRAIGAGLGLILWGSLAISYLSLSWAPSAVATKIGLIILDAFALWYAAGDAKRADIAALKKM